MNPAVKKAVLCVVFLFLCSGILSIILMSDDISSKFLTAKTRILDIRLMLPKQQKELTAELTPENYSKLPLCPEIPPDLESNVQPEVRWKAYEKDPSVLKHVQPGGSYRPPDCRAREHVAIVVPFRDREEHLRKLLIHLHQFLPKQKISYQIFVAEMAQGTTFNTGMMQNVGFELADKTDNFTCFVIHDVDLMPTNENNLYKCDKVPLHIATNNSKYNYRKLYNGYFGGVISVRRDMYYKANGFSNVYFGWGSQDDDFRARLVHVGLMPKETARNIGVYEAIPHEADPGNPVNVERGPFTRNPIGRMKQDGMNSLQYKLLKQEVKDWYTWILVEVNKTQIMEKFKNYH